MDKKSRKELYEKLYFHQFDYRDKLEARISFLLTITIAIFTYSGFIFKETKVLEKVKVGDFTFYLFLSLAVMLVLAIYYFIRSWFRYQYKTIATASELENYIKDLEDYYKNSRSTEKNISASVDFDNYLHQSLIETSTHNQLMSEKKSSYVHKCSNALILCFVLLAAISVDYYYVIPKLKGTENDEASTTTKTSTTTDPECARRVPNAIEATATPENKGVDSK